MATTNEPDAPELDRLASTAIASLDAFRKAIVNQGFPSLSLVCMQLSNVIEEWLLAFRQIEELKKQAGEPAEPAPPPAPIQFKGWTASRKAEEDDNG